jgi:protein gp37
MMAEIEWKDKTWNPLAGCDGLPDPWEERLTEEEAGNITWVSPEPDWD